MGLMSTATPCRRSPAPAITTRTGPVPRAVPPNIAVLTGLPRAAGQACPGRRRGKRSGRSKIAGTGPEAFDGRWTLRWRRPPDRWQARASPPGPAPKRSPSQRCLPPMLSGSFRARAAAASWQCRRPPQESGRARPRIVHSGPSGHLPGPWHAGACRACETQNPGVPGARPSATGHETAAYPCCVLVDVTAASAVATEAGFPVCCAGSGRSASPWPCPSSSSPATQVSGNRVQGQRSRSPAMARQGRPGRGDREPDDQKRGND